MHIFQLSSAQSAALSSGLWGHTDMSDADLPPPPNSLPQCLVHGIYLVKTFEIKSETREAAIAGLFAIAKAGCPGVGGREGDSPCSWSLTLHLVESYSQRQW